MRVKEFRAFGTSMLTLVGTLNVAQGLLVAFAGDRVGFDRNDVAFISAGTWAAATATLGALLAGAGLALRARRPGAKAFAASVVALHAVSQLAMLSAYPAWSLLMVTLDVIMLFILTAPQGSVVAAEEPDRPAPTAKLILRRNSRSDAYRGRHKAGRPPVRHSVSRDDIIAIDLLPPETPGPDEAVTALRPGAHPAMATGAQDDTVVVKALVGAPVSAALAEGTIEAELVGEAPGRPYVTASTATIWVRAVGHATVPHADLDAVAVQRAWAETVDHGMPVQRASFETLDAEVPVQRGSLETLDPLVDPLPRVLAEEETLAAIGPRPYVTR